MELSKISLNSILNWTITLLVALTTAWNVWTTTKLKKATLSLNEHSEQCKSFQNHIDMLNDLGNKKELDKVRYEFARFEETWRNTFFLKNMLNKARDMGFENIDNLFRKKILSLYKSLDNKYAFLPIQDEADLSYLSRNYKKAISDYAIVLKENPNNKKALLYGAKSIEKAKKINPNLRMTKDKISIYKHSFSAVMKKKIDDKEKAIIRKASFELKNKR
ncbi:MAG: hypothetical protein GY750_04605 [Lentisphaerae bacterium]|nr:hypothetical protein [Lentisphaerota bacterium]MCP4100692.1 hypothetical protein [Lentisphaerota bacterium]